MSILLISYDLVGPEDSQSYKNFIDVIKSYKNWAKPLESFWFVETNSSPRQVRDYLKDFIDSNDKLLVMNVSDDDWASFNLKDTIVKWMQTHI